MSGYNKRYKALVSSTQSFFHFSSYLWVCFFFFSFLFVDKGLSRTKKTLEYLQKRAEGVPTPQDWFLEAYVITREADSLFVSKNYLEAEKKYKIAYNLLGSIKSNYPEWESAIVRYRTKYVKEKLDSVMRINAQNSDVKKKYLEEELPESNPLINPQQQVSLQELQSLKNKIAELTAQLENMKKEKEALLENLPYNQPRSKMEQPKAGKNFQFQGMTTKEISLLPKVQDQAKKQAKSN